MALRTDERLLIEQRVTNEGPSIAVAYLLWLFLGFFGAHRFYLGRPGTAILLFLSFFVLIGFIWYLVDAFLIPGMIRAKQDEIRRRMELEFLARGSPSSLPVVRR